MRVEPDARADGRGGRTVHLTFSARLEVRADRLGEVTYRRCCSHRFKEATPHLGELASHEISLSSEILRAKPQRPVPEMGNDLRQSFRPDRSAGHPVWIGNRGADDVARNRSTVSRTAARRDGRDARLDSPGSPSISAAQIDGLEHRARTDWRVGRRPMPALMLALRTGMVVMVEVTTAVGERMRACVRHLAATGPDRVIRSGRRRRLVGVAQALTREGLWVLSLFGVSARALRDSPRTGKLTRLFR